MAVGCWDVSLAQALAAEISERHLTHSRWEQQHGMTWKKKEAAGFEQARACRDVLDAIGRRAYQAVLRQYGGRARLTAYLAQPDLCSYCLNVKKSLAPCLRGCGRQLCTDCRTQSGICHNTGICRQRHPIVWRAGIKLLDEDNAIHKEWQAAAELADAHTVNMTWGRNSAGHQEEARHMHNNFSEQVVDRWERFQFGAAGLQGGETHGS